MSNPDLSTTNQSIMSIFAHADDLEIQTGGTLLKYKDLGYDIVYVMTTNNFSGQQSWIDENGERQKRLLDPEDMEKLRKSECDAAAEMLGTTPIHLDHPQRHFSMADGTKHELRYGVEVPDGPWKGVPSICTAGEHKPSIDRLAKLILEHNPEAVLTHNISTYNVEHWASAQLAMKAYRQAVEQGYRGGCLQAREAYHFYGEFHMRWDTYVDCSDYFEKKMELIGKHYCQMPNWQEPDFGHRAVAEHWGKANGCKAAECFVWVRRPDFVYDGSGCPVHGPLTLELMNNHK